MGNEGESPARAASRRRKRAPKAWKVCTQRSAARTSPRRPWSRSRISPAALLVKVTARTCQGMTPSSRTSRAIRWTMTRVLPLPAPARTRSGPSPCSTASRWASLRSLSRSSGSIGRTEHSPFPRPEPCGLFPAGPETPACLPAAAAVDSLPVAPPVRILPLGGLGEIGMNCMAVECDGRIAVVDCGILFPNEPIGVDVIAPDLTWLRERREQVGAVYLTHGHEDHIGALPFLLRDVKAPVYGTPFTLALLRGRLAEANVDADLRVVAPGDLRPAGEGSPIAARFLAVTHSIPDACGLALSTPQGTLLHTGDFKIDESPVRGPHMDLAAIEALGKEGVRLLLSDSTNAERAGVSLSESRVGPALEEAFEAAKGRVFVACFASNVHRIQGIVNAARAFGRRVAFLGRSMEANVEIARTLGYLDFPAWMPCSPAEARTLPPKELCVLTTGTQGEPRSALARLARGDHPELEVSPGDLVILSSRFIPGNEAAVGQVVNDLCRRGAEVIYESLRPLHVSGHAQEAEQRRLIALARPRAFVPIHGEYRHLARHAAHAAAEGVPGHIATDG